MSEKFDQVKYKNEYSKANYYTARVIFPKADEQMIKSAAAEAGQSVSEFIKSAVMERLKNDIR